MFRDGVTDLVAHFSLPPSLGSYSINENKGGEKTRQDRIELLFIHEWQCYSSSKKKQKDVFKQIERTGDGGGRYTEKLNCMRSEKGAGEWDGQRLAVTLHRDYQSCIKALSPGKISPARDCFWTLSTCHEEMCS